MSRGRSEYVFHRKQGQVAAEALQFITDKTSALLNSEEEDDIDPFEEDTEEDEDELADNELALEED